MLSGIAKKRGHVMSGKKRNADAPGKATINCSLNSLLATAEAIFNRGTLRRNDTSATRCRACSGAESLRTSLSSKVSTCQNC
jgi:hypothetical protein